MTFADSVAKAVLDTTREWAAIKKKEERDRQQAARMIERYCSGRNARVTVKDASCQAIPDAYLKASGAGQYPANARQIMYAARPAIQEATGQILSDTYFTQTLLPNYIQEHASQTADWDVVYDARGHLWEPHTGQEIGIGTVAVREYLAAIRDDRPNHAGLLLPELPSHFPTCGPRDRYGAILYVEKEGFLPLLQRAGFAQRYDLAIMSSKGMGTTAARSLLEKLCNDVRVLVLHDFDKSGFSIIGTLTRDTRRYSYATEISVVDLGLRLQDVQEWQLLAEEVIHVSDPTENLRLNRASEEEIAFLRGKRSSGYDSARYRGRRVELNAFTSEQFVMWLELKLKAHSITKVIPDSATLDQAYRRAAAIRNYRAILRTVLEEVESSAAAMDTPTDLKSRLARHLARNPSLSWDQALEFLLPVEKPARH